MALMAVFSLLGMGVWMLAGGDAQSVSDLKWLQFIQTLSIFLLPAIIGAWLWSPDHRPFKWLGLSNNKSTAQLSNSPTDCSTAEGCLTGKACSTAQRSNIALAIATMLCALPAINLLADLNSRVVLPECMASLEAMLRAQEEAAAQLTERFLRADDLFTLFINISLLALLPALAEEISFRGTLQQIITNNPKDCSTAGGCLTGTACSTATRSHTAIWVTAFLFSAIHLQFYGFVPRMLMGAMFGYIFVWTGSLWIPILMHAVNNAFAVITYYIISHSEGGEQLLADNRSWADTIGTGTMWWLGVLSLILTLALLCLLRRQYTRHEAQEPIINN